MPRVGDILLLFWIIYVSIMIIGSWFGPGVSSFEDWFISMFAWWFLIVAAVAVVAVRGTD